MCLNKRFFLTLQAFQGPLGSLLLMKLLWKHMKGGTPERQPSLRRRCPTLNQNTLLTTSQYLLQLTLTKTTQLSLLKLESGYFYRPTNCIHMGLFHTERDQVRISPYPQQKNLSYACNSPQHFTYCPAQQWSTAHPTYICHYKGLEGMP